MLRDEDLDDERSHGGTNAPAATVDDARREFEHAQKAGLQSLTVRTDKHGNSRIFGFKIPNELLPAIETALPNAVLWLQRSGSQFAHDKALWLAQKFKAKDARVRAIATAAEMGIRWAIIGLKPATDSISIAKNYAAKRKELFKEFKPVIDATGVDYKNNEVIRNAFDNLHDNMIDEMKGMAADMLTLAPTVYIGLKDQKAAAAKRKLTHDPFADIEDNVTKKIESHLKRAEEESAYSLQLQEDFENRRKKFIESKRGKYSKDGKPLDDKALSKMFEETFGRVADDLEYEQRQRIRAKYTEDSEDHKTKKGDSAGSQAAVLGLSVTSQIVKTNIRESADKRRKGTDAWRMICHLKEDVDAQVGQRGAGADGLSFDARGGSDIFVSTQNGQMSLPEYILEIFQQHERDRLPKEDREKIEDLQHINLLGPALVERLMPSINIMAQYIADGRLNPHALVNLVGDGKIVRHMANDARTFAKEAEAEKIIDGLVASMGTHSDVKEKEFFANYADPELAKKTVNTIAGTSDAKLRTAFIAFIPDQILEAGGMKKQDIVEERKAGHKIAYNILAAADLSVATEDVATLKKLGLSETQINAVQTLAQSIEAGDEKAIKLALDGRDKSVVNAIGTVVIAKEMQKAGDGTGFLASMVKKASAIPEILAKGKKRVEEEMTQAPPVQGMPDSVPDMEGLPPAPESGMDRHQRALAERASREEPQVTGRS